MGLTKGGCHDLRKQMNDPKVISAFGKLVSGKEGYTPIIEKRQEEILCGNCKFVLNGDEKFCPECGAKVEKNLDLQNKI